MASDEGHESKHYVYYKLPTGQMFYTLTGVVLTTAHTEDDLWHRDTLLFDVAIPQLPQGKGLVVDQWAPFVTINSVASDGPDPNAAWAVDGFDLVLDPMPHTHNARTDVEVRCNIAVRGAGAYLLRVGYIVNLLGQLLDLS
jgi:hypothetical protein